MSHNQFIKYFIQNENQSLCVNGYIQNFSHTVNQYGKVGYIVSTL